MTKTTDNIIDRDELQKIYAQSLLDGMDWKDMERFVLETLNDNLDKYTVDELIEEVEEYQPHLLEQTDA